MTKRRRIIAVVLAMIFFGAIVGAVVLAREKEPVYKGRKVSEWRHICESSFGRKPYGVGNDLGAFEEASEAIVQMREWVIPRALKMAHYETPEWKNKVVTFINSHSKARRWCPTFVEDFVDEEPEREAWAYFYVLGTNGAPAVPELVQMLCQTNSSRTADRAGWYLALIGKAAVPALSDCLKDVSSPCFQRAHKVFALMNQGRQAEDAGQAAVPMLIEQLSNSDPEKQRMALVSLAEIGFEEDLVVPAIASVLQNTNASLRVLALDSLSVFGERGARSASPLLSDLLRDEDENVREATTNLLRQTPPEVQ